MRIKELVSKINLPARASMGYLGASLIGKVIGLVSTPFFTRLVSEEEYGTLTLYMTILGGASVVSSAFSSGSAIYRGMNKYEKDINAFLKSALTVSIGFSMVFCTLLFALWGYTGLPRLFFLPLALQIICDGIVSLSMARARFKYRYFEVMLVSILTSAMPVVFSILILSKTDSSFGVRIYLMLALSLLLALFQLIRILKGRGKADRSTAKYILRSALPLLPHSVSVALSGQADKLFVTRIMGAVALAKYSVVHSLGVALQFAVTALGSALGPWIVRRLNGRERDRVRGAVGLLFPLLCALSLGLCTVAPEAMTLLAPEKYLEALPALFPIAISTPLCLLSFVITVALVNSGKGKYTAAISLMNLALCVTLNYTLISPLGYFGAGLALLLSQLISVLFGIIFLKASSISDIFPIGRMWGCLSFSILVGALTNLFFSNITMRILLLVIPLAWGLISLIKCKALVFEKMA